MKGLTVRYLVLLGIAVAAGTFLRLFMLPSQILLDDEWHALNQVIGRSIPEVLSDFNTHDNTSLPLNLYNLFLYEHAGWSETGIRLPVILAGLLGLVVLPLALRAVFNDRVSLVFAFLLAIAPFPVFYSRFARAYGITMALCFLCLLFAVRWLTTGDRRSAAWYIVTGTLAVYTHVLSFIVVLVPFLLMLWTRFGNDSGHAPPDRPGPTVSTAGIRNVALIQAALLLPLSWIVFRGIGRLPWAEGYASAAGIGTAATLLSGTVNIPLNFVYWSLCVVGFVCLFRRGGVPGRAFLLTVAASFAFLMLARPKGIETGAVLLRYMIVAVPVAITAVAVASDSLLTRAENSGKLPGRGAGGALILFAALLFVYGPLPLLYASPNNFMNHSAFQGDYHPPDMETSEARHVYPAYSIRRGEVTPLYRALRSRPEIGTIVEYPMDICNYNNLLYFFQAVHGKNVIAGYATDRAALDYTADVPAGEAHLPVTVGMLCADQILSRVPDPGKLQFRNMVDVSNPAGLLACGAEAIVLHKDLMALKIMPDTMGTIRVRYGWTAPLAARLMALSGPPLYEDSSVVCFSLRGPSP